MERNQTVGKRVYVLGKLYKSLEETDKCDGCAAKPEGIRSKQEKKHDALLCGSLPHCSGVIWEEQ